MARKSGRQLADDALALALARGASIVDAAAQAGVSLSTAKRRWADRDFKRHVSSMRAEMIAQALGRLASNMADAADTLKNLLSAESEQVRLQAARALLDIGTKLSDAVDLAEELADIKALLREKPHANASINPGGTGSHQAAVGLPGGGSGSVGNRKTA